jgi:hypothetical protein
MRLLPIVEGDGDKAAVPLLLRRMLAERHGIHDCKILNAQKRGEYPSVRKNFDNGFKMAIKENAAILWILDFDCDDCKCVKKEADALIVRANQLYRGWPIEIAFMVQEYETLFLSDKTATRSVLKAIPAETDFPADPESIRGAKEWLSNAMPKGVSYKETVHQSKITAALNFDHLIEHSPSFAHIDRALARLVGKMHT